MYPTVRASGASAATTLVPTAAERSARCWELIGRDSVVTLVHLPIKSEMKPADAKAVGSANKKTTRKPSFFSENPACDPVWFRPCPPWIFGSEKIFLY